MDEGSPLPMISPQLLSFDDSPTSIIDLESPSSQRHSHFSPPTAAGTPVSLLNSKRATPSPPPSAQSSLSTQPRAISTFLKTLPKPQVVKVEQHENATTATSILPPILPSILSPMLLRCDLPHPFDPQPSHLLPWYRQQPCARMVSAPLAHFSARCNHLLVQPPAPPPSRLQSVKRRLSSLWCTRRCSPRLVASRRCHWGRSRLIS